MTLRRTKRYQYATEGVRGDGASRRNWLARLGFWRFDIQIEIVYPSDKSTDYVEPYRDPLFGSKIVFTVRFKDKTWVQQYIIPHVTATIVVTAKMMIHGLKESIVGRFVRADLNKNNVQVTVKAFKRTDNGNHKDQP